ncbi:MAG: hypothetical protein QF437_20890 [Planctomycetota bacterium]|jgi:hypothetical protein|nr:hypothetical protein [Planctomycetota bacterium]MDP7132965.1 hypothetical protein [Planctomycetota bacterium]MDP7255219.1 hypothetical protein [Planctomycetota bacterium]
MNASAPETGLIRQITIQDVFAGLIVFSVMCGLCELLANSVVLRFEGQVQWWEPKPGFLHFQIFLLMLPNGILAFALQSGRDDLQTCFYLQYYIISVMSIALVLFVFVTPEWLKAMHVGMSALLVVHLVVSILFVFFDEQSSLAVRVPLAIQAQLALIINEYIWRKGVWPGTYPPF